MGFQIKMASAGQEDPSGAGGRSGPTGPIVHERGDSNAELEALFAFALNQDAQKRQPSGHLQVPLRMRNLPASFWNPPTIGSKSPSVHSRENSLDNSLGQGAPFSPGPVPSPGPAPPLTSLHSRANSCPATLGQTLAVAQQHQVKHLNSKKVV